MGRHRLKAIMDCMQEKDLQGVYNCFWSEAEKFSAEDIKQHIQQYIITYYKLSSYKQSCKEKCYFLIKQIEDYE